MNLYPLAFLAVLLSACSSEPGYRVKDDGVYWVSRNGAVAPLKGANPKTFQVIAWSYGRDETHIYRAWEPLEGAYFGDYPSSADAAQPLTALYTKTDWLLLCDYPTFHNLDSNWQADSKCVYWHGSAIRNSDPATFHQLGEVLGKDKSKVYIFGHPIASADAATFERACGISDVNGKDRDHCYWYDHEVPCDCKPHSELEFRSPHGQ